jgi:hypothetical protein
MSLLESGWGKMGCYDIFYSPLVKKPGMNFDLQKQTLSGISTVNTHCGILPSFVQYSIQ